MGEDVGGVEAGVVAELPWDYLEGFGEGFDDGLLFARDGGVEVGVPVEVGGDFHLLGGEGELLGMGCCFFGVDTVWGEEEEKG